MATEKNAPDFKSENEQEQILIPKSLVELANRAQQEWEDGSVNAYYSLKELGKALAASGLVKREWGWVCNECGSEEFTSAISESDLHYLACSGCGGDEFHKEFKTGPSTPSASPSIQSTEYWQRKWSEEYARRGHEVAQLHRKIAEIQNSFEWQPIETAPKDGTEILLTCMISDMAICYWSETMNDWTWGLGKKFFNPSHWMDLPPKPQATNNPQPT